MLQQDGGTPNNPVQAASKKVDWKDNQDLTKATGHLSRHKKGTKRKTGWRERGEFRKERAEKGKH